MSTIPNSIENFSLKTLNLSSNSFKSNDAHNGFMYFDSCLPHDRNKVYEQIWIDRGMPQGNPEYGRHTFRDEYDHYSTMQEKAIAIDRYVESEISSRVLEQERQAARLFQNSNRSSYEWTHRNGEWNCHPVGYPPHLDPDKIKFPPIVKEGDNPSTADGRVAGCIIGAIGSIALFAIFLAHNAR
jgi:hypothetical protein